MCHHLQGTLTSSIFYNDARIKLGLLLPLVTSWEVKFQPATIGIVNKELILIFTYLMQVAWLMHKSLTRFVCLDKPDKSCM